MPVAGYDFNQLAGLGPIEIMLTLAPVIIFGVIVLGVKYGYWGFIVLAPGDRAFRERFGKPVKYFDQPGKVFFIRVIHWIRRANINPQSMEFSLRVARGKIGEVIGRVEFCIIDEEQMVKRAIYGLYDPNRSDLQNDERIAKVRGVVLDALRRAVDRHIANGHDGSTPIGYADVVDCTCRASARDCGTRVIELLVFSMAPTDAQIEATARKEAAEITANAIEKAAADLAQSWPLYPPAIPAEERIP